MWNTPSRQQLDQIPRLYETEHIPAEEKLNMFNVNTCGSSINRTMKLWRALNPGKECKKKLLLG